MNQQDILRMVDEVIAAGPYKDTWASLSQYSPPAWYADAKFGIFIHWGPYAVPAFGNEWYPRHMYIKDSAAYEHHRKTWGPQNTFGYKDFIPLFKGEKFDAEAWMDLFQQAGARYVMPVAEHHDGFQMYKSELSHWNAAEMGPKRDIAGELKAAAEERGIVFALSNHRAEHCWFFNGGRDIDSDVNDPTYEDFYWKQQDGYPEISHDIHSVPPTQAHCEDWLARVCEMVDRYQPRIVWFDWWIHNVGFKPYLKKFAAYYYNRAAQWGVAVAINYKYDAYAYGTAVFDVERGQLGGIRPLLWQTDTAIARNSWGYTDNNDFKTPQELVRDLIDIVSKNGCMLLNVGPRADGTITEEDRAVLLGIGAWLARNGEGIYGTTFWKWFGEGPTNIREGAFSDKVPLEYTQEDFRYTYKEGTLYAFAMRYPKDGRLQMPSLRSVVKALAAGDMDILDVRILGYDRDVSFTRDDAGLSITVAGDPIDTDYPVGFAITID